MPARKRNLVLLSHREAVDLAPDSADKRAVVECANARFLLLNGDITEQNLVMLAQLQKDVALMPAQAKDDTQRLRILAFCLRLAGQVARLRKEREQIREEACRFARIAHFRQTGTRVGDLFDPISEQVAAGVDTSTANPDQGGGGRGEGDGGPVAGASGSVPAGESQAGQGDGDAVQRDGGPAADGSGSMPGPKPVSMPASKRQIKETLHYLKRYRVNGDARENFRRRAQAEGWDKPRLSAEAHKLTAA